VIAQTFPRANGVAAVVAEQAIAQRSTARSTVGKARHDGIMVIAAAPS
jgi:hypothetical protein